MHFIRFILAVALCGSAAHAQSTINEPNKFAYGANTGWVNFRPSTGNGVVVGEAYLSGHAWSANTGWIQFGDGSPANGYAYANTSAADFGVNHDGAGNLAGLAYSANTGWIQFGWAAPLDPNRPRISLITGQFSGYAYGANTGWINLGAGYLKTDAMADPDTDGDQMADAWEMQHFGNLATAGPGTDADKDGASDAAEYAAGTDPNDRVSWLRVTGQTYSGNLTQVTLVFSTTSPSRLYRLEHNAGLTGNWTDSGLGTFAPDPGGITTRNVTFPSGDARFFRAVAVKPLQP